DRVLDQPATAPRMVLETPRWGIGSRTEVETTLTTRPQLAARMPGRVACSSNWLATRWLRNASSYSRTAAAWAGPPGGPPVLFTRIWTGCAATSAMTFCCRASGCETSAAIQPCRWPSFRGSPSATRSGTSARRASTVTSAPSRASSCAAAWPMPSEAPQTSAWRPSRVRSMRPLRGSEALALQEADRARAVGGCLQLHPRGAQFGVGLEQRAQFRAGIEVRDVYFHPQRRTPHPEGALHVLELGDRWGDVEPPLLDRQGSEGRVRRCLGGGGGRVVGDRFGWRRLGRRVAFPRGLPAAVLADQR